MRFLLIEIFVFFFLWLFKLKGSLAKKKHDDKERWTKVVDIQVVGDSGKLSREGRIIE